MYLGAYDNEEAAAHAFDLAALKYWGQETLLNFHVNFMLIAIILKNILILLLTYLHNASLIIFYYVVFDIWKRT